MWSSLKAELLNKTSHRRPEPTPPPPPPPAQLPSNRPIKTTYRSNLVPIPPDFLTSPATDSPGPVTTTQIHWPSTPLAQYGDAYAVVLDNVLSPSECATLLALAEASVPRNEDGGGGDDGGGGNDPWQPALVNVGGGYEVLTREYRNSDRIVWDCQEVVDRIWRRCVLGGAEGLVRKRLAEVGGGETAITGGSRRRWEEGDAGRWKFLRVNERMRFLRYKKGQFFKPHCDAPYFDTSDPERTIRTLFTIHVYLNDSKAEAGEDAELVGGATSFFSSDEKTKLDVNPKAGRVLIFQHHRLLHSGDDVLTGIKYSMRTDIMYEYVKDIKDKEDEGKGKV
ncbi:hypothetical protein N656DRAFT_778347 [Canariomyces notabilis]|uniref:Prolyl 4-hydroxylase alpha subunit domain-containing protein n=1 Tax=Canariomyces notabilis TaxID=2074819 RepID=A0AAN6YTF3_9PEZI|nr:hypothetical protein N656DRAFT_778347 [Canariomyces arenarius]